MMIYKLLTMYINMQNNEEIYKFVMTNCCVKWNVA